MNSDIIEAKKVLSESYIQELKTICGSIYESVKGFEPWPLDKLQGKLSALRGILKGIELLERDISTQQIPSPVKPKAGFNIDSLRGQRFTNDELRQMEHIINTNKDANKNFSGSQGRSWMNEDGTPKSAVDATSIEYFK